MTAVLPPDSFVGVTTRRLAHAEIAWRDDGDPSTRIDPEQIFCVPQRYEAESLYGKETRGEWADRYGGSGVGAAGGSGRCTMLDGLQTKGSGVTPLVSPHADSLHSSGTLLLFEAATEALFAGVYQACLPFGAVPVRAVALTGGRYSQALGDDPDAHCVRSLIFRPFVARPAHFMRNLLHPDGLRAAGDDLPGLTADTWRTAQAMTCLAPNFKKSLALPADENDEAALLDAGLRELARRLAWQCAAGFAKRLPHGTLSCSNIALNGAYLDFGVSNFNPSYRRLCWAHGQEPWTESLWPIKTLLALRQQMEKYWPPVRGRGVVGCDDLSSEYGNHLQQRLAIEMAKMAGLTEDMAVACPSDLLSAWLKAMRNIWVRGAHERFVTDTGHRADGKPVPPPRRVGCYDLNAILAAAGPCADAECMDRTLTPLLDDPALRRAFVQAAIQVRAWLRAQAPDAAGGTLDAYLGRQARRKNAVLPALQREKSAGLDLLKPFRQLESSGDTDAIGSTIDQTLAKARHVLADLDPELPGDTGMAQLLIADASFSKSYR
ncbi:MAG TPA: hypothetical protein VN089_09240 [Duganella sp.]|nr:hypothetical protein [Duganella sp.]